LLLLLLFCCFGVRFVNVSDSLSAWREVLVADLASGRELLSPDLNNPLKPF
jgi:hypothetical protein